MKIENTVALVTGANRGIGAALVHALLEIEADEEDIFFDPMSRQLYVHWTSDHKADERQFAAM